MGVPVAICTDVAYAKQGVEQMQQITDPSIFTVGLADWYGNHYLKGQFPDKPAKGQTTSIFEIYDQWGIPPGLGEWGPCEGDVPMSPQDWDAYTSYIYDMMYNRLAAGGTIADIAYYSGQTGSGPNNVTAGDFKIPAIRRIASLGRMVG